MPILNTPAGLAHRAKINHKLRRRNRHQADVTHRGQASFAEAVQSYAREIKIKQDFRAGRLPPIPVKQRDEKGQYTPEFLIATNLHAAARSLSATRIGPGQRSVLGLHRAIARDAVRLVRKATAAKAVRAGGAAETRMVLGIT